MDVITPAQLLLAIAEHESLEATCAALPGMTRDRAQRLLRGVAQALQRPANPEGATPQAAARASQRKPTPEELERAADALLAGAGAPKASASVGVLARPGEHQKLKVFSDGASRGNPGPAGAGAVLVSSDGATVARLGKYLGKQTNNVAEYEGLLLGLRAARELGAREVEVVADSELLIRQLQGRYQVKNAALQGLFAQAQQLLRGFEKASYRHVLREYNKAADEMSNRAIDEKL